MSVKTSATLYQFEDNSSSPSGGANGLVGSRYTQAPRSQATPFRAWSAVTSFLSVQSLALQSMLALKAVSRVTPLLAAADDF
jgi:hypothetical protein